MRVRIHPDSVQLWLSANDTYGWANHDGAAWPYSQLADNRVYAEFDSNGLCELTINGKSADVDANELSACCADHLAGKLPADHPCRFIVVDQFRQ